MRVAFLVDHPDRDLPGLVLTAVELARHGVVSHFAPANLGWREIWALAPDLTVFNYARRSNERLGRALAESGRRFVVLDTEGGVWPEFSSYTELLWDDRRLLHQAARFCSWGPRMAEHLVEESFLADEQVRITGCPRFDFYHPDWRSVLSPAPDSSAPRLQRRVLINTNFSTRNPRFATVAQKIETSKRNFGWSDERIRTILEIEERAIEAFIRMTARLAREIPECGILVRPHPFEDPAWYQRELGGLPNVEVDNDGPVQPAIHGSAVVIQRSCTTAIEAGLAGLPTLSPLWIEPPFLMPVSEAVSVPCHSYDELAGMVSAALNGEFTQPPEVARATEQVVHDWFCASDGLAHHRVAEALLEALPVEAPLQPALSARNLYLHGMSGDALTGLAALGGRARMAAGLSPDWSFRSLRNRPPMEWSRTSKFYDAGQVQELADRCIALMRGRGMPVPVVRARFARENQECRHGVYGHSVTLSVA